MDVLAIMEKILTTSGFNAMLLIVILLGFYKIIDYVLRHNEQRERDLMSWFDRLKTSFDEKTQQEKVFQTEVRTAHDYQKEEHKAICNSINTLIENIKR